MAIPPQFLRKASTEDGAEEETASDRKGDSPAVKAREYGNKKKKKRSKAQQDAIARRLSGGKGSGRN